MADRPTRTIETPVGKAKITLYEYAIGSDKLALQELGSKARIETMVERLVTSIEGAGTDGKMAALNAMHGKDFNFVINALADILTESSLTTEKKS